MISGGRQVTSPSSAKGTGKPDLNPQATQSMENDAAHPNPAQEDAKRYASVEVVIVAWRPANLLKLIHAFRSQTIPCRIMVITTGWMVDGQPVDEATLALADRVIRTSENFRGFNRFMGVFALDQEFTYFHDDDMLPGKRVLEHLLIEAGTLREFGIIGQLGRLFKNGGYDASNVARRDQARRVDMLVRGYFIRTKNLVYLLEVLQGHDRRTTDDDLLLTLGMARNGLPCYLSRKDADRSTLMNEQELDASGALCGRSDHYRKRDQFVRANWKKEWLAEPG
jgi:hypothetical protein